MSEGPAFDPSRRGLDTPARLRPRSPGAGVLEDTFIVGGWRAVRDITQRDAIPNKIRSELMVVLVGDAGAGSLKVYFMPEGSDLDDNGSWAELPLGSVGVGHGTLGTPTDGTYADGAVALSVGMLADDAIDAINEYIVNVALLKVFVCPGSVAVGDAVYISATNFVREAVAALVGQTEDATGIVLAKPTEMSARVVQTGEVPGAYSGLTPGGKVWLSLITPGGITQAVPAGDGVKAQQLGYASNPTSLYVDINESLTLFL